MVSFAFRGFLGAWLFCYMFSGCNKASNESAITPPTDPLSISKPLDNFEADPTSGEYGEWETDKVGANPIEEKQNIVKKFNSVLVFHAADTMQIKQVYTATLALARNASIDPIKEIVLEASDASNEKVIVDTNIELGKRMKADLIDMGPRDEPSFIIKPLGYDEQNLGKSKPATWQWSIEPLKEGPHKLKLSVKVILSDDDRVNLPARNIPVMIFAKKVSFLTKVGNFFGSYWQWIITGILLPIFIAWLTNSLKQRNEQKSKPRV